MNDRLVAAAEVIDSTNASATEVCQVLSLSRSSFYGFQKATELDESTRAEELCPIIIDIFWKHRRRYGSRRITSELADRGIIVCRRTVAESMKMQNLKAIQPKSFQPKTTDSRHRLGYSPNLLLDSFELNAVNRLWVADITHVPLADRRFAYLSMIMDRFSRRLIGWKMDVTMTEQLVIGSLKDAIMIRQPGGELIHHSDRGGQYASIRFRQILKRSSIRQSMSRAGDCYDNAVMKSCFGTIKTELEMTEYETVAEGECELGSYFSYYNQDRKHSSLGYQTPNQFESTHPGRE
ncbi:IS3 family transposase [Allorhodopirellula heiligendammensis]|uniref:Integrase core domain protein n=1 Tax=Allorhodopirellula heiligendammensis TaxID=2714739 RepID=A0A5C6C2D5_9BACT|nr:IS3 family transposase [Allorhodopirellula heiligendammensis]TWU18255.1 Integrase core domain protein [Allorhodopirellula heiligendammensis]